MSGMTVRKALVVLSKSSDYTEDAVLEALGVATRVELEATDWDCNHCDGLDHDNGPDPHVDEALMGTAYGPIR